MKIARRSPSRLYHDVEMCWKILPNGARELIIGDNSDGGDKLLHDLNQIFSDFIPRCLGLIIGDIAYDWNIPRSIDASYTIASDLYLEGQMHQSARMVFFAAILCEHISDTESIVSLFTAKKKMAITLRRIDFPRHFAHIHLATVNTRTTKLLRDFLSEVHPSKDISTHKWREEAKTQSTDDTPLFNYNMRVFDKPKRKLITLFIEHEPDVYQEFQVYEGSKLSQIFRVWWLMLLSKDSDNIEVESRLVFLFTRPEIMIEWDRSTIIQVNGESDHYIFKSANKTLGQLGINEGDTFKCRYRPTVKMDEEEGEAVQQETKKPVSRNAKKQQSSGRGKMKRKTNTPFNPPPSNQEQEPTKQQLKEAHSKMMEPVLNEMRPQLQPIRRKLDSLTLHRRLPKQKKGPKVKDKENVCNFTNIVATSGGKAGKIAFPIVVGQVTNLFNSSKPSRSRNTRLYKIISLDLHGLSKKQALEKLNENLPRWVDTAMKGEHPWVIPIDIICGGGNQVLSEVVTAWIRSEHQVANRPKSYFM